MKKRVLSLFLVLILLLSGCVAGGGNPSDPEQTVPPQTESTSQVPEYNGSPVTITFAHHYSSRYWSVLDAYIAEFNKLYPNITVTHKSLGEMEDIHEVNRFGSPKGNIVTCLPEHAADYFDKGLVVALDDYMKASLTQEQWDDQVKVFYEDGKAFGDGKTYTLPLYRYTDVLYYNKDFFDLHGLTPPTTWEEMESLCKRILQLDPQSKPLLIAYGSNIYYEMSAEQGTENLFAGSAAQSTVERLQRWQQAGYMDVGIQDKAGYISNRFVGLDYNSRCYMAIDSSNVGSYYYNDFEVGVAALPGKTVTQGVDVCVMKSGNEQEEAASWLFVKFMTTNADFQAALAMVDGYMPAIHSAAKTPAYTDFLNSSSGKIGVEAKANQLCLSRGQFLQLPVYAMAKDTQKDVEDMLYRCLYGQGNPGADFIARELAALAEKYKDR